MQCPLSYFNMPSSDSGLRITMCAKSYNLHKTEDSQWTRSLYAVFSELFNCPRKRIIDWFSGSWMINVQRWWWGKEEPMCVCVCA